MLEKEKLQFIKFRKNIPVNTTIDEFTNIFGKPSSKEIEKYGLIKSRSNNNFVKSKMDILYKYRDILFIFDWVRYIGVTGSLAAGSVRQGDDIDIFIVVKNGRMWIYRGLMLLKMLGKSRRASNDYQKDLFCINMIIEERGLKFDEDLFNFHELMMMKNVFNYAYKDYILSINKWVKKYGYIEGNINVNGYYQNNNISFREKIANWFAYISQVIYMILLNHKPDISRIREDNRKGRIQFYKQGFKEEKLKLLK